MDPDPAAPKCDDERGEFDSLAELQSKGLPVKNEESAAPGVDADGEGVVEDP